MALRNYDAKVLRVIDARTILATIKLGFGISKTIKVQIANLPESAHRGNTYWAKGAVYALCANQFVVVQIDPSLEFEAVFQASVYLADGDVGRHADAAPLPAASDSIVGLEIGKALVRIERMGDDDARRWIGDVHKLLKADRNV